MRLLPRSVSTLFGTLVFAHLREEKIRSAMALAGIALGVAIVVAISLANAATLRSFRQTVDSVAGRAQLQVRGNGALLDERLLAEVEQFSLIEHAAPTMRRSAGVKGSPGETLLVLGVDTVKDAPFRDYAPSVKRDAALSVLLDARSIVVTERFANRRGLKAGDDLVLLADDREIPLRVADILASDSGPAQAMDGNVAIMDIAAAQDAFRLRGKLETIDAIAKPGANLDRVREGLAAFLPANVLVERPAARGETVDKMLRAFQLNLEALSHIALLVGAFLIYNAVSVSVARRRAEIGTLRALGARRGGILAVFLAEGALFGVPGAALGCLFGWGLSQWLVEGLSQAVSMHWEKVTVADGVAFDPLVAARGAGAGLLLSLVAAFAPAREAARVEPANTTREGSLETRLRARRWWLAPAGALLLFAGWRLALLPPVNGLPIYGFASALCVVFGFASMAPFTLSLAAKLLGPLATRLFGAEGLLAASAVEGSRHRATVAITGLMVGLAMAISVGIMVGSFRKAVATWLEQSLVADLYIQSASLGHGSSESRMPLSIRDDLAALPFVDVVDTLRMWRVDFRGRPVNYGAWRVGVTGSRRTLNFLGGAAEEKIRRVVEDGEAMVTETFAYRHGVKEGDEIELPVENGVATFRVAGIYREYSSDLGTVVLDWETMRRWFPSETQLNGAAVFLKPGVDADDARRRLYEAMAGKARIIATTTGEVRRNAMEIFDRTFAVTRALLAIAIVVAVLGVANTLMAMIVDRRQELGALRCLGMSRRRLARVVMIEGGILGAAGTALGAACGVALSLILVFVVNKQSFGWTIPFAPPWPTVAGSIALLYLCSLLAGALPAREAAKTDPRR